MPVFLWIFASGLLMSALALVGSVALLLTETTLRRISSPLFAFAAGSLLSVWVLDLTCAIPGYADNRQPPSVDLEVFTRAGCPRCAAAAPFLADLQRERPALHIRMYDIEEDPATFERLKELATTHGVQIVGVPAFYLRGELLIGYRSAETTGMQIKALLDQTPAQREAETIEAPLFGPLSVHTLGLPLFTFILGLLDGFNPCSMWVLLLMLSMLASLKDRIKMVLIAGTFVAVEGIAYFAFMAAWLNVFLVIGLSRLSGILLGGLACVAGIINLKDFWAFGWGISLSIPKVAKPGIYAKLRRILQAENLTGALVGTVVLAVLVQLIELLCTTGFPALYTRILTLRQFDRWTYYGYLLLYDLAYMLDDVLVLAIGVITLSQHRLQEKEGRWLKLLSGVVMLGLGVVLLFKPEWLAG